MARRLLVLALGALVALTVTLALLWPPARAAEDDRGVLANMLSRALSSQTTSVSIGAVDGALSSDATIRDVVLSDRDGPWLKVDKVRLVWSRLALLQRRLQVDELTVDHIAFLRRPLRTDTPPPPDATASGSILPELPLKVVIGKFAVKELALGEPVVGVAARLDIAGKATLGPPSEGLDLTLTSRRLDAPGEFKALLTYVPANDKLTLAVNSEEPAGGLFAHLANLPGLPPVKLAFNGAGPLDSFDAKLDFAAGADVWARGDVLVARQESGRQLTLDLNSRLEGMAPPVIRPVFAGETTLKGAVLFGDDGVIALPGGLHLVSRNARLDFEGGKAADNTLGIRIHAGAIPGATQIGKLDLNASIVGPIDSPVVEGAFEAGDIHVDEASLDHVAATFHVRPTGSLSEEATRIQFEGQGAMNGLKLTDPTLARAIGSEAKLTLRGSATTTGDVNFDVLSLVAPDFEAHYSGLVAAKTMRGRLDVAAHDLSRFAPLAGGTLRGEASIGADLDGAPRYGALSAKIDAKATHLGTAYSILDRATGGELRVTGAAQRTADGFGFSNLLAAGAHGSARLNGTFGRDNADMNAKIDVPQASVLDPRIAGHAEAIATLSGPPDDLAAALKATLSEGRLLDRKTTGVTVEAEVGHLNGLLEAKASVSGDVGGHPLVGSAHVAKTAEGGWAADNLALSLASARLDGSVAVNADDLASGELRFSAANLDDLSPLVLTQLGGALNAKVSASNDGGKQAVAVVASSAKMSVGGNRLEGLAVDLAIGDLWGARSVSGSAKLSRAQAAGESISDVRLTATGGADASELDFGGTLRGLAVKARGRLSGGPPARFDLTGLTAQGGGRRVALAGPATLTYGDGNVDIRNFALQVDSGRLVLSGRAGDTLDLHASATALPLAAFDLVSPGLGLTGVAEGDATIRGTPGEPTGDWRLRLKQVSAPQLRAVSAPPLDVAGSGRLSGGRTSLDVAVNAGRGNAIRLTGSAPLKPDGALDVRIDGKLDAGLANNTLSVSGRSLTGALAVAMQARGTLAKPQAQGEIRLTNGEVRDDQTGFRLSAINAVVVANGDTLRIDRFSGATPNGGSISATGDVRLDPAAGFPGTMRLTGKRAQVVANAIVTATADMALSLSGPLAQRPKVEGRITIDSMDITVPNRFGGVSDPIPGTKHVNPTPTARARLAQRAKAEAAAGRSPLFDATLSVTISATNRIFIRGRGINAELAGDLKVAGSARDPQMTGGFDLLRGSLSILGKRLVFTRGQVRFHGDATPDLDFVAETNAADITARISVTGPASQPVFTISSSPSLPEDEILSRVLFQRPSGNLSAFQALELASAAATLSGNDGAFDQLRRSLGADSLNISSGASGGGLFGLGRAINDRISVEVTTGARPADNGVGVDVDVTRHVRLQAGVDATGGSSVGVGAEWEYK
jgi:translocation and assembly module TamB